MAVEAHDEFACVAIDSVDITDVAVVDVLVVVILDLHDLVTGGEGPAEPLDFPVVGGIESGLQFNVERSGADTAAVHRAENLDVADGVEAEPPRDPGLDQLDDTLHRDLGLFDRHEVEIAFGSWRSEIGNSSLIDPMRIGDDAALRGLAKYLGETRALNCWPWVRSFTHSPDAVIHSPAAIVAACPTTVTRSRCPRTFARRTQNPFSALWKVTRSTRPASTSWVDDTGCGFIRIDASSIFAAALKVGGRLRDAKANLAKLILCYAFARYLLPQGVRLR